MALSLRLCSTRFSIFRTISNKYISTTNLPDYKIAETNDGSTMIVWHPKTDFPYECTRPLPEEKIEENSSVLKTTLTPQVMEIFNKKTPEQARQELMNITYTTKHRWFPRARDKKAKDTPMNREYL